MISSLISYMFTLPTIPHPITLHHLSSDKSENRFGLMQQICTPLSKLIFSDMSRKEQILRPKTDSVSIEKTQNQQAWGNVYLISAPSYIETPHSISPVQSSPVQSSLVQSSPVQSSSVQFSPVQSSPFQSSPVQPSPVQSSPV